MAEELSSNQVTGHSVIAAIDFGTSTSGYAFGFLDSGNIELSDIQLNKQHYIGSDSLSTDKAPTTVLLKPDKTFHSFGFNAEDAFAKLCDKRKQNGWWYFQKFKMKLYTSKLSRQVMLEDAEGKTMLAKDVFTIAINHLKGCVLADVRKQHPEMKDDAILYVLTVPAIWSDAAKQFMREAATGPVIGITDNQLKLVIEPEAASVFCRQRPSRFVRERGITRLDTLEIGHKYIILDLGGGTADIATHEIIENGRLHEIDYSRGDDLGGLTFNETFLRFLSDLIGEESFKKWQLSDHADYLKLQRDIEGMKWKVKDSHEDDNYIVFKMPHSLVEHVKDETGQSVGEKLLHSNFDCEVKLESDVKFRLKNYFVKSFFDIILTGVTQHMSDICKKTSDIETVFIVGGLAQSSYVVKYIECKFPQYTFIVPEDPGVAVLKGAVILGNRPQTIAGRIARYSYGIGVTDDFVEGKHNEKYMIQRNGVVRCCKIFKKLIEKGQVLTYGDSFKIKTFVNANMLLSKHNTVETSLYQSTRPDPIYYDEPGCTELGGIIEYPPTEGWPDGTEINVEILVGEAEFRFQIEDSLGGKYVTTVDFLAQK